MPSLDDIGLVVQEMESKEKKVFTMTISLSSSLGEGKLILPWLLRSRK